MDRRQFFFNTTVVALAAVGVTFPETAQAVTPEVYLSWEPSEMPVPITTPEAGATQTEVSAYIKNVMGKCAEYILWEPNDLKTRDKYVGLIDGALDFCARHGHIYEYKVVCDESNNTPELISQNGFAATVYVRYNTTLKYSAIEMVISHNSSTFDEVVTS